MSQFSATDLQKIAKLSKIALSPAQQANLLPQFEGIFTLIETMQAIDTTGITPLIHPSAHILKSALRLREDAVTEHHDEASRTANLRNAPESEAHYFLVPRVVE